MWSFSIEQVPSSSLHYLPPTPTPLLAARKWDAPPWCASTVLRRKGIVLHSWKSPSLDTRKQQHPNNNKKSHQTAMQISLFTAVWNYNEHTALPCFQCPAVSVRMPVAGCQHCCPLHRPASLGTWSPLHIPTMPTGWIWWLLCLLWLICSDCCAVNVWLSYNLRSVWITVCMCMGVIYMRACTHTHTHTHTHTLSLSLTHVKTYL